MLIVVADAAASIMNPSFGNDPSSHAFIQLVTSMEIKLFPELTGNSEIFGAPNPRLPLVLSVSTSSSHALVTGVIVIGPNKPEVLFTQRRKRACFTSAAAVP